MKKNTKTLLALLLVICSVFFLMPQNTLAKLKTTEEDFWDQPAGNLLESFKYEEVEGGVSLTGYIKFSNGSGADSFDFFIIREDGTMVHDQVSKSDMSHTSSGSYYYYKLKTVVKAGEKIKAGCCSVKDQALKSDEECKSIAIDVKVAEAVVLDESKQGKQCEKCGSTEYKVLGRVDYTETTHTMEYQCKDCGHCWEVTEDHAYSEYKHSSDGYHSRECSICGDVDSKECEFEVVKASVSFNKTYLDWAATHHNATYKCKECGFKKTEKDEAHDGNHKCSVCGWNDKKPGKLKSVNMKVTSKKNQSKTFKSKGHFDSWGNWVPAQTYHGNFKVCKVKISYKKPSGGYYYVIHQLTGSGTTAQNMWTTKKTNGTYDMLLTSSDKKCKIKITVYNKNGIARSVTKTISV